VPLPDVSHLQFVLLDALINGPQSGRDLREVLAREGNSKSTPAFYQLMARMEDGGLVSGRYDRKVVEGQIIKERIYSVTAAGATAHSTILDFYAARHANRLGWEGV
jgi:DNA-binding PadR family transcriptional regulator